MNDKQPAKPISLRLSTKERAQLEQMAGSQPLSAVIRKKLFGAAETPRKTRIATPIKDHEALGRLLGLLGQSELAASLAKIAKAAEIGALPLEDETVAVIRAACADIQAIRAALMQALGFKNEGHN